MLRPKGRLIEAMEEYRKAVKQVDRAARTALDSGVSHLEVAEAMGISEKSIRRRLKLGRSLIEFERRD